MTVGARVGPHTKSHTYYDMSDTINYDTHSHGHQDASYMYGCDRLRSGRTPGHIALALLASFSSLGGRRSAGGQRGWAERH